MAIALVEFDLEQYTQKLTRETNRTNVADVYEFAMTEACGAVINFDCWRQQQFLTRPRIRQENPLQRNKENFN